MSYAIMPNEIVDSGKANRPAARRIIPALGIISLLATHAWAANPPSASQPTTGAATRPAPPKTFANIRYGDQPRQILDVWLAKSDRPTPVVIHMHGGGWATGNKGTVAAIENYLNAGISVVSISYRYVAQAQDAGVMPPVEWPMYDAARALQFVRTKAAEWNLDKQRIAFTGTSAGACTSLWLAFHDDLAKPHSPDPVLRESTRLWCVAVNEAQTSLDPLQMKTWTPNSRYGGHAFSAKGANAGKTKDESFAAFLEQRETLLPWINEYSPIALVTADDPPVYLFYKTPLAMGQPEKDPTHSANFGRPLQEKLNTVGVECELNYPGAPNVTHPTIDAFLIEKLKQSSVDMR